MEPENQEGRCRAFKYDEWAKRTTPSADVRHDNIEAIYKTLQNKRDTADVTEVLKELHRIVNEAIRAAAPGGDHAAGRTVDLSQIDFEKLRNEFASKVRRKHAALQDIRDVIEHKLAQMLACNPLRMDYYKKYQAIIADYNREKDRATVEATFAQLVALAASLDTEQRPAAEEGLSDDELALFDVLFKDNICKKDRERLKQASRSLLSSLRDLLVLMPGWLQNTTTQAEVKIFILDRLYESLPSSDLSFRMAAEKSVTVAKQSLRASLRSELSGENRSGGGAPVKIKGLDDDEEEHEHSWGK